MKAGWLAFFFPGWFDDGDGADGADGLEDVEGSGERAERAGIPGSLALAGKLGKCVIAESKFINGRFRSATRRIARKTAGLVVVAR